MDRWPVVRADYGPFRFTATHCLPKAAAPHGRRAHGHKWSVWVVCESEINPHAGWAWDEDVIPARIMAVLSRLDGKHLNDVMPMPPTNEAIAVCLLASLPGWVEGVRVTRDGDRGACLVTRKMNGRRSMAKWAIKAEAEIRE